MKNTYYAIYNSKTGKWFNIVARWSKLDLKFTWAFDSEDEARDVMADERVFGKKRSNKHFTVIPIQAAVAWIEVQTSWYKK